MSTVGIEDFPFLLYTKSQIINKDEWHKNSFDDERTESNSSSSLILLYKNNSPQTIVSNMFNRPMKHVIVVITTISLGTAPELLFFTASLQNSSTTFHQKKDDCFQDIGVES